MEIDSGTKHPSLSRLLRPHDPAVVSAKTDDKAAPAKSDEAAKTVSIKGTGLFVGQPPPSQAQDKAVAASEGVTLNLVGVPAAQAARTILGDMLAVRYTIDPAVKGEITIQTPHPVSKAAIVDLFRRRSAPTARLSST